MFLRTPPKGPKGECSIPSEEIQQLSIITRSVLLIFPKAARDIPEKRFLPSAPEYVPPAPLSVQFALFCLTYSQKFCIIFTVIITLKADICAALRGGSVEGKRNIPGDFRVPQVRVPRVQIKKRAYSRGRVQFCPPGSEMLRMLF